MGPAEEQVRTDIQEEVPTPTPEKQRSRVGLFIGLGAVLTVVAIAMLITALRSQKAPQPAPTAEDQEQQKYDAAQGEQERQKAAGIRNDPFLVRREDNSQSQLASLLKNLNIEKEPATDLPPPAAGQKGKSEEEAVAHVLRDPPPPPASTVRPNPPRPATTQSTQLESASDADMRPMFVYSRTFGGAKFVDAPPKQATQRAGSSISEQAAEATNSPNKTAAGGTAKPEQPGGTQPAEQNATLLYTDLPPVTLYEGEMLEAVLVNRIIADTEPAPVVCHLSRDYFDHSARYVVFPANSRIVGLSQVVNYKGAHRLFINFQRIILPNGPSLDLPSSKKALKALDETGALGVVSKAERHWFLQFGTAVFFGALDGLAGVAQRNRDSFSPSAIVLGRTSENFERILETIMSQYSSIVPTIRVDQGKKMRIYLSDDVLISPYAKISDRSYYAKH